MATAGTFPQTPCRPHEGVSLLSSEHRLMYLKPGVSLRGLRPEMVCALLIVNGETNGDFVVTSGTEDAPGRVPSSLHPQGLAVDIRMPTGEDLHGMDSPHAFKTRLQSAFETTEYDLVFYDTHVHIEYDPK
jgi:hypothetical protein